MSIYTRLLVVFSLCLNAACFERPKVPIETGKNLDSNKSGEIAELRIQRDNLIAELQEARVETASEIASLTLERDVLSDEKSERETAIDLLQAEIESSKTASAEEKAVLDAQLLQSKTDLGKVKEKMNQNAEKISQLMSELDSLSDKVKALKNEIVVLNAKISSLEKELAAERAKNKAQESGATSTTGTQSKLKLALFTRSADGVRLCMEQTNDGLSVVLNPCGTGKVSQEFSVASTAGGSIIQSSSSNSCLHVGIISQATGTSSVSMSSCKLNGTQAENWSFIMIEGENFHIRNVKTGFCLASGGGTSIVQKPCDMSTTFTSRTL